jgi:hypothetical protein
MIFNPWFILGAILALLGVYSYGHHSGYQERVTEDEIEIARLNDEARTKEAELNKKVTQTAHALRKAKDDIATKQVSINERIRAGELRISSQCSLQTDGTSAPARGDTEDAAKSEREILKSINEITAQGDIAITRLNACIDFYNKAKELQ